MKKILMFLLSANIIATMGANKVLAETKGNYIGLNMTHIDAINGNSNKDYRKDLGISYAYGLNFNRFAVLPELYYNFGLSSKLQETYGFRMNLGYDFTPEYSIYGTVGVSINSTFDKQSSMIYGLSFKSNLNDNFSLKINMDIRDSEEDFEALSVGISYNF